MPIFGISAVVNPRANPRIGVITVHLKSLSRFRLVLLAAFGVQAMLLFSSCATPKEINGEKITGTRWVNGKIVYVTAPPTAEQQEKIRQEANELRQLNDETKFEPVKK